MGDLDKTIVAKGFKKLPKVQQIAQSGHTARNKNVTRSLWKFLTIIFYWNDVLQSNNSNDRSIEQRSPNQCDQILELKVAQFYRK